MQNDGAKIAAAIRAARNARRWSIRDACAVADISPTTWINAEKGIRVSDLTRTAITQALGWPEDAFVRLAAGATVGDLEAQREGTPSADNHAPPWALELLEEQRQITRALERLADQLEADEAAAREQN